MSTQPTSAAIASARLMRESGWSTREIARHLSEQIGRQVSHTTIRHWTNPTAAEQHRSRDRQRKRAVYAAGSDGRVRGNYSNPLFFDVRARALADLGLRVEQIAAVMRFDFPDFTLTDAEIAERIDTQNVLQFAPRSLEDVVRNAGSAGITRRGVERLAGLGPNAARYAIAKAIGQGVVVMVGAKRGARYVHIDELSAEAA